MWHDLIMKTDRQRDSKIIYTPDRQLIGYNEPQKIDWLDRMGSAGREKETPC